MEKNIYTIIQDWHELFKNGTITEDEFNLKKNELLNLEKITIEDIAKEKKLDDIWDKKNAKSFYKKILIGLGILCLVFILFNIYNKIRGNNEKKENDQFETESSETFPTYGKFIVQADNSNTVHFYAEPNITTEKKSYFSTADTVYVSKTENGFGYVEFINSNGQNSIGWLPLEKMIYCGECPAQTEEEGENKINKANSNIKNKINEFLENNIGNQFCYFVNTDEEKNENGYCTYNLVIKVVNSNEVSGSYNYIPNVDVDSFGGELKGKINGDFIEGILISEGEGMTSEEKFKLKITKEIALIKFENEPEKVMNRDKNCK